jgi:hypothetical protein
MIFGKNATKSPLRCRILETPISRHPTFPDPPTSSGENLTGAMIIYAICYTFP